MKRFWFIFVSLGFVFVGCEQHPDDTDNAFITGYVYMYKIPTDSVYVIVDTLIDTVPEPDQIRYIHGWVYSNFRFEEPVESAQVWVETDENSQIPWLGGDLFTYTDENGFFKIPVYLGHKYNVSTGYEYVYYADVQVWGTYKGIYSFKWGGGITLSRGKEFRLPPIAFFTSLPSS